MEKEEGVKEVLLMSQHKKGMHHLQLLIDFSGKIVLR